jgi:hypothetical protein
VAANPNRYICLAYNVLVQDAVNGASNWSSLVQNLLFKMGMSDAWNSQCVGNVKVFICMFKQHVRDINIREVRSRLQETTKGSLYLLFNPNLVCSQILGSVSNALYRKALTRLRLSSHHLNIETGRWHKPHPIPRNERLCQVCNVLEDEYHFVCECPVYNDIRLKYIPAYYRNRPCMYKFIAFVNSSDTVTLQNFAIFVYKACTIYARTFQHVLN